MFNIADIIVVAIIGLTAFICYKKGFVKAGLGFLSFFIAIAMTFMFYKPVMGIIKERTEFESWLTGHLSKINVSDLQKNETKEETSNEQKGSYINNLPDIVTDAIGLEEVKQNAKNAIIQKIVDFAVKLLAIVIVYVGTRFILFIAIMILDLFFNLPGLKQFNELLGLALGIVLGLIRVFGIFIVITLLSSVKETSSIVALINNSLIASFLYNNNLLLKLLF